MFCACAYRTERSSSGNFRCLLLELRVYFIIMYANEMLMLIRLCLAAVLLLRRLACVADRLWPSLHHALQCYLYVVTCIGDGVFWPGTRGHRRTSVCLSVCTDSQSTAQILLFFLLFISVYFSYISLDTLLTAMFCDRCPYRSVCSVRARNSKTKKT